MAELLEKEIKKMLSADVVIACEDLGISLISWFIHFENVNPYHADCKMCNDYLMGVCDNPSGNPIECFKGKKFIDTDMVV